VLFHKVKIVPPQTALRPRVELMPSWAGRTEIVGQPKGHVDGHAEAGIGQMGLRPTPRRGAD
jgi:hypothetical protein